MTSTKNHNGSDGPAQKQACDSDKGGCCQCQQVIEQMSCGQGTSAGAPIKEVLLVFLLPLVCAAAVVIWAVRYSRFLSGEPWFLVLTALGVGAGAIALVRLLRRKSARQVKDN